jgi:hypothetical protein
MVGLHTDLLVVGLLKGRSEYLLGVNRFTRVAENRFRCVNSSSPMTVLLDSLRAQRNFSL